MGSTKIERQTVVIAGKEYELAYNDETHQYFVNDIEYPSVTTILKQFGFAEGLKYVPNLEFYSNRGRAVHTCCDFDDEGCLDESSAAELMPYVEAWRKFKKETGCRHLLSEITLFSPEKKFCGRVDRVSEIEDDAQMDRVTIIDIKHGAITKGAAIQTAGYKIALNDMGMFENKTVNRIAVKLSDNGKYKIHRFDKFSDMKAFASFAESFNHLRRLQVIQ